MLIDCDVCVMQHTSACDDCIVTVLLAGRSGDGAGTVARGRVELDDGEAGALRNLADAGLVSPLRLVMRDGRPVGPAGDRAGGDRASGDTATGRRRLIGVRRGGR